MTGNNGNAKAAKGAPKKKQIIVKKTPPAQKRSRGSATAGSMQNLAKQMSNLASGLNAKIKRATTAGPFEMAGRFMGSITGTGDYILNDIVHQRGSVGKLKRGVSSNTITNCEYIRDIVANGSSNFAQTVSPIHPTEETLFPWLVNVSKLYTKYRFKQLIFEFRSMSSEYSSQIGLGTIIMAPQYNIDAPLFSTKQQMEAATHAVSFKPSNSAMMGVECSAIDNNVKWYNVRNRDEITITNFTDPGRFCLALAGIPTSVAAGTTLGELWVHYTIELIEPVLSLPASQMVPSPLTLQWWNTETGAGNVQTWAMGMTTGSAGTEGSGPYDTPAPSGLTLWRHDATPAALIANNTWLVGWAHGTDKVYFSKPGVYYLDWFTQFTVAPTAFGATPFNWVADANYPNAACAVTPANEIAAAARQSSAVALCVVSRRWKIVVTAATNEAPAGIRWVTSLTGGLLATQVNSQMTVFAYPGVPT